MSDAIDRAQALAEHLRDATVAAVRAATSGAGADECAICGVTIPEARRKAVRWAETCIDCQTAAEREAKGFACR